MVLPLNSHQFDQQERKQQPTSATLKSSFSPVDAHVLQSFCFPKEPMQRPILLYPQLQRYVVEAVRSFRYRKYNRNLPCENAEIGRASCREREWVSDGE